MGGWQKVIYLVSFLVGVKLVVGLYSLGAALTAIVPTIWTLGAAFMATPIGWILGMIALIATAVFMIYKNWEPIKFFFNDLWEGVKYAFLSVYNFIAGKLGAILAFAGKVIDTVKGPFAADSGGAGGMQYDMDAMGSPSGSGAPSPYAPSGATGSWAPSALPTGAAAKADVGGTLKSQIDQQSRARVSEAKSNNQDVDYAVYTGMTMAGA